MALFLLVTNVLQKRAGQSAKIKMAAVEHSRCKAMGVITITTQLQTM
jgi:hypothetical protein